MAQPENNDIIELGNIQEELGVNPDIQKKTIEEITDFGDSIYNKLSVAPTLVNQKIISGSGNKVFKFEQDKGLYLGNQDFDLANFSVDMDGNATANTFASVKSFTYGEDIDAGEVVCFKNTTTDYEITNMAWANEALPDTNYGTDDEARVGRQEIGGAPGTYNEFWTFFQLPTIPDDVMKVELIMTKQQGSSDENIYVVPLDDDIDEDTLTWNNRPNKVTTYGVSDYFLTPAGVGLVSVDITEMVRYMKAGLITHTSFGIYIDWSGSETPDIRFYPDDTGVGNEYKPFVRVTPWNSGDGKLYLADSSDYNLCRNVIGIAKDTKVADETGRVFVNGIATGLSAGLNSQFYLSNVPGQIAESLTNLNTNGTIVPIGKGLSASEILLELGKPKEVIGFSASLSGAGTVLSPIDGEYCTIYIEDEDSGNDAEKQTIILQREETKQYRTWRYDSNDVGIDVTFTWNNDNTIDITENTGTADYSFKFYNR
jgi:hypothetical protein